MFSLDFRADGLWLLFAESEEVGPFQRLADAEAWLDQLDQLQRN